ncbi:pirin family protein [Marinomonas algarum]|uniref:Pirin family protein n=1 Tax=Marinomonas algarum TaxID=2883105 RepID=A0A9X1LFS1_9GAMM|nr:pirin family protein [Marinomonas algarum]MCB5163140.1 pirin family protein [Marinomonas algarum]
MNYIRKSEHRGVANFGWLQSKHSFSFGNYYDPKHMGVSVLRVINDDMVMPGQGFGEHGHRDMEIISYVIEGALKHDDSTGNSYVVPAGDVQRMSAGRGVRHSEFNASKTEKVKFLQIWIQPNVTGIKPSYEQKSLPQQGVLTTLVAPNGENGALSINQDASISRLVLKKDDSIRLSTAQRVGYLHLIKGQINVDGHTFKEGDAFAVEPERTFEVTANAALEALWFDLPAV